MLSIMRRSLRSCWSGLLTLLCLSASVASAQTSRVSGIVRDETGGVLPGCRWSFEARPDRQRSPSPAVGATISSRVSRPAAMSWPLPCSISRRRGATSRSAPAEVSRVDVTLHLALSADVTVTGMRTFANLADLEDPAGNLVGVAQSASQGAITSRQLDMRPLMRAGEVLETVPGVIISQHSGEGKANQYYLRGFNLDHGTDFAATVAGMPVNMPTHGHGHGYSDLNFLIPELVSGVQYSKGPYFADQGDFATAGAANIHYTNRLDRPAGASGRRRRGISARARGGSPRVGPGHVLAAVEIEHNDGPWTVPDNYRKVNGLVRYSQGDSVNGFSVTAMGYRGTWNSTDQVPRRAVDQGIIGRFGALDPTDGGDTYRYSGSIDWQRAGRNASTKVTAYGIGYDLNLFSNFTFFLDDPEHGDQFHQADHRFVSGVKVSHSRMNRWAGRALQHDVRRAGQERCHRHRRPVSHRSAPASRDGPAGQRAPDERCDVRAERNRLGPLASDTGGRSRRRYRFQVDAGDPLGGPLMRGVSVPRAAWSSARSAAPSCTRTPATASIATTRAARR